MSLRREIEPYHLGICRAQNGSLHRISALQWALTDGTSHYGFWGAAGKNCCWRRQCLLDLLFSFSAPAAMIFFLNSFHLPGSFPPHAIPYMHVALSSCLADCYSSFRYYINRHDEGSFWNRTSDPWPGLSWGLFFYGSSFTFLVIYNHVWHFFYMVIWLTSTSPLDSPLHIKEQCLLRSPFMPRISWRDWLLDFEWLSGD